MQISGLHGIGEVRPGDDLATLLIAALTAAGGQFRDDDVLVVSSKIVSKAEGRVVAADTRDAQISAETVRRVAARRTPRGLAQIVEAAAGPVMAAAGVDASNVAPGTVLLLPKDPDASARELRARLTALTGARIGVILSDTAGRAWRDGQTDFALGAAGVAITDDLRGAVDTHGQPMEVTVRALVDELAAAADLVKGKVAAVPAALIRDAGVPVTVDDGPGAAALLRRPREDWFRYGHVEAVTASLGLDPAQVPPSTIPPGPITARLARALEIAITGPQPWTVPPANGSGSGSGSESGSDEGRVSYAVRSEDHDAVLVTQSGAGTPFEAAAGLGALAQRIAATAWAEDLTLEITLLDAPAPALRITEVSASSTG